MEDGWRQSDNLPDEIRLANGLVGEAVRSTQSDSLLVKMPKSISIRVQTRCMLITGKGVERRLVKDEKTGVHMWDLTSMTDVANLTISPPNGTHACVLNWMANKSGYYVFDARKIFALHEMDITPMEDGVKFERDNVAICIKGGVRVHGRGIALLEGFGGILRCNLNSPGSSLTCDPAHLVGFSLSPDLKREAAWFDAEESCEIGKYVYQMKFIGQGEVFLQTGKNTMPYHVQVSHDRFKEFTRVE